MRKIPAGAEASNILVGEVDFLNKPLSAFIRLKTSTLFGDLTEVPVPTRFLFILLGPMVYTTLLLYLNTLTFERAHGFVNVGGGTRRLVNLKQNYLEVTSVMQPLKNYPSNKTLHLCCLIGAYKFYII